MKNCLLSIREIRGRITEKKEQAKVFCETYAQELGEEDLRFLEGFTRKKSGPVFYFRYRKLIHSPTRFLGMILWG